MTITLARIDDRLIHGQTTTRWSKERVVDGIIIIGNDVINDQIRLKVLKAAARDFKLGVYSENQAVEKVAKASESNKNFFLITSSPQIFDRILKAGAKFGPVLNVGCMNTRDGATVVGRTLAIDKADYNAFDSIEEQGVKVEFQLLPDNEVKLWKEVKDKYDSLNR